MRDCKVSHGELLGIGLHRNTDRSEQAHDEPSGPSGGYEGLSSNWNYLSDLEGCGCLLYERFFMF